MPLIAFLTPLSECKHVSHAGLNVCGKACKAVDDFWKGLAKQSEDEGFIQTPDCPTDITVTVTEGLSAAPTQLQRAASCVAKRLLSAFHAVRYVQVGEEQVEVQLIEALIERKHPEWQFQNASTVLVWKGRRRREDKLEVHLLAAHYLCSASRLRCPMHAAS